MIINSELQEALIGHLSLTTAFMTGLTTCASSLQTFGSELELHSSFASKPWTCSGEFLKLEKVWIQLTHISNFLYSELEQNQGIHNCNLS